LVVDIFLYRSFSPTPIANTVSTITPTISIKPTSSPPTFTPPKFITAAPSPQVAKSTLVSYLPIPGSGSTQSNLWENVDGTEFYLNTADYPHLDKALLEATFKLQNGNGIAFIRLFDVTSGVEVWGSEITTRGQNYSLVISPSLTLRPGNHLYRLQLKSLTADTVVFNSARIKIFFTN